MIDHFQNADSWTGGTFDALMYFGDVSLHQTIQITNRLWTYGRLDGPYRQRNFPRAPQTKVLPEFTDDGCEQLVGRYRLVDGQISPFIQTTVRGDEGLWIYAGIPMGGFPENWNVGAYPFDDGNPVDWTLRITDELRSLSAHVREHFPMLAASYGWFDVSVLDTINDALHGRIPDDRWNPIEIQTANGWQVYPATKLEPLFR